MLLELQRKGTCNSSTKKGELRQGDSKFEADFGYTARCKEGRKTRVGGKGEGERKCSPITECVPSMYELCEPLSLVSNTQAKG